MKNHQLKGRGRSGVKTVTTKPAQLPPKRPIIPNCEMRGNVGLDFLHLAILELNRRRTAKNRDRNLEP
jgi:hypothetical protein